MWAILRKNKPIVSWINHNCYLLNEQTEQRPPDVFLTVGENISSTYILT